MWDSRERWNTTHSGWEMPRRGSSNPRYFIHRDMMISSIDYLGTTCLLVLKLWDYKQNVGNITVGTTRVKWWSDLSTHSCKHLTYIWSDIFYYVSVLDFHIWFVIWVLITINSFRICSLRHVRSVSFSDNLSRKCVL